METAGDSNLVRARPGVNKLDGKEKGRGGYNTGSDVVNLPKLHQSFKKSEVGLVEDGGKRKGAELEEQGKKLKRERREG